ncbi:heparinase [Methylobacterium radiotolerans]|uniref:heparinase n=1 Tax=Methylobacterium radiotolerans TaxID=31998 RepID=UPI0015F71818|nr:heparinase [Methylobacterium radiotolerans]
MSDRSVSKPVAVRQVAGAANPREDDPVVGNKNRWSRAVFAFDGLSAGQWYEFSAYVICDSVERALEAQDLAAIGVAFLTGDRSEIDFARVPGLIRTSTDAHGAWLSGPRAAGGPAGARSVPVRLCFYLPAPAAEVAILIRSWRNTRPFRVVDPEIRPTGRRTPSAGDEAAGPPQGRLFQDGRIVLGPQPTWFRHGLVPGRALVFRGQVIAQGRSEGALAQIRFRDADGDPIPPPYPDTLATLSVPAFLDIPVHRQAYRFTLKVYPPPDAATLDIGFATWEGGGDLALTAAPDVLLDDDLRLANLTDDADPGVEAVLARLLGRLAPPDGGARAASIRPFLDLPLLAERPSPLRSFARLRDGPDAHGWAEGAIRLAARPAWRLPEAPDWAADPFRSQAWRLAFQSLAWTWAAAESPERGVRERAVAAALSWSRANPWGQPADTLSLHPACAALRLEAMLSLLEAAARDAGEAEEPAVEILGGEVVRHAAALAEILAQHTVAGSLLELQVAAALLAAGLALPAFPMSRHWTHLAVLALRSGFETMIDPGGGVAEPSYHRSLELLTLALILVPILAARPELAPLAELLDLRLPAAWAGMIALFEPDGALPPFDARPDHPDRHRWLERLAAAHARPGMALPVPGQSAGGGGAAAGASRPGTLIVRRPDDGAGWSAFTADFSAQVDPQDHRDCTAFTFATGGLRWITEGEGQHVATARAHNVALPDGREPGVGAGRAREALRLGDATVYRVETTVHGPDYRHVRTFVLLEDLSGIAVFDRFATRERPLAVEGFLHLDSAATVALDASRRVFGLCGGRRLHILPCTLVGRFDDLALSRDGLAPRSGHGAHGGPVLRYGLSGTGIVEGGLLIAASAGSVDRLTAAVEGRAFQQTRTP